jgi:hypothetical protein
MSKAIALCNFQANSADFRPVYRVRVSNMPRVKSCACPNDGMIAFLLPWMAVTTVGTLATFTQSDTAFLLQAIVPGLVAGVSGISLYKVTKKAVKLLRSRLVKASC